MAQASIFSFFGGPKSGAARPTMISPAHEGRPSSPASRSAAASPQNAAKRDAADGGSAAAKRPRVSDGGASAAAAASAPATSEYVPPETVERTDEWLHLQAPWLRDIKDKNRRRPTDEGYDPTTLDYPKPRNGKMPSNVNAKFKGLYTPAQQQWWEIKSQHFDTVLLFKVGKFYEMFHMDAELAVRELGIQYMGKKEQAHAGFPEKSFAKYAQQLVDRNYRVARIEQTETPQTKSSGGSAMMREACQFLSAGTNIAQDEDDAMQRDHQEKYLVSLIERKTSDGGLEFGVCVLDSSTAAFEVGAFSDDAYQSRLGTLLSQLQPAEVVHVMDGLSEPTRTTIRREVPGALLSPCSSAEQWDAGRTIEELGHGGEGGAGPYFKPTGGGAMDTDDVDISEWPELLQELLAEHKGSDAAAAASSGLALVALGGAVAYIRKQLVDFELVSLKNFRRYLPYDMAGASSLHQPTRMVLDNNSVANLEILVNEFGDKEHSLLDHLDHCVSPAGKRLLKKWLLSPLYRPAEINERLDAIDELKALEDAPTQAVKGLSKLPDFERLLARIHGTGSQPANHPMARAVIYEDQSKRRIAALQTALRGFRDAYKVITRFGKDAERGQGGLKTRTLRRLCTISSGAQGLPELEPVLEDFDNTFDLSDDVPKPMPGVDREYDESLEEIEKVKSKLDEQLSEARADLGCRGIDFINEDKVGAKNRYCLDMPLDAGESAPSRYIFDSKVKSGGGRWRGRTQTIINLIDELEAAEDVRDEECKNVLRRVSAKFASSYPLFKRAWECLAELDVLVSLSAVSKPTGQLPLCRPTIVDTGPGGETVFELQQAWHPIMAKHNDNFIANDTSLGGSHANCLVLTGPNMGGKSTLLRQTAVVTILAQLGCYVPASSCRLSPTDRIFTRMGARDSIMTGESTFMVEMNEAAIVLNKATCNSLVLMDELGRGTSTFDGVAIAYGVVKELSTKLKCRSLFSTHYHTLMPDFKADPTIYLAHMGCLADSDAADAESADLDITFLYKLTDGACPQSFGMHVAKLGGMPEDIVRHAVTKSQQLEASQQHTLRRNQFAKLAQALKADDTTALASLHERVHV